MSDQDKSVSDGSIIVKLNDETQTAEIIRFISMKKNYSIPKYIEHDKKKYNIIRIGDHAFSCSSIETLTFEYNSEIISIGQYAFANCKKLEYVNIQSSKIEKLNSFCFQIIILKFTQKLLKIVKISLISKLHQKKRFIWLMIVSTK